LFCVDDGARAERRSMTIQFYDVDAHELSDISYLFFSASDKLVYKDQHRLIAELIAQGYLTRRMQPAGDRRPIDCRRDYARWMTSSHVDLRRWMCAKHIWGRFRRYFYMDPIRIAVALNEFDYDLDMARQSKLPKRRNHGRASVTYLEGYKLYVAGNYRHVVKNGIEPSNNAEPDRMAR